MHDFTTMVFDAQKKMRELFPPTPCEKSNFLSKKYKADIFLKREDLSPVRSYKLRGAFHFISEFLKKSTGKSSVFVCSSLGNFAQGIARACVQFQVPGKIFMPLPAPKQKIDKVRYFGGKFVEIVSVGDSFDESTKEAKKYCQKHKNSVFVPPFDDYKTIEGNATIAAEILDEVPDPDFVIVPVGGGGLVAGISKFFSENSKKTKILCAEPAGAPSFSESLRLGEAAKLSEVDSFIDGAAVGHFGKKTFKILEKLVDSRDVFLIPENRVCRTILSFLHRDGIVLEPAGALSIDALNDVDSEKILGKKVVCVVSGGNFDFERLPEVKDRAMKFNGTKKYLILRLPQRPGSLREFLNCLGGHDDISRFEYLKKSSRNFGSVLIGIETPDPKNFEILFKKMKKEGIDFHDVTENEILADFVI